MPEGEEDENCFYSMSGSSPEHFPPLVFFSLGRCATHLPAPCCRRPSRSRLFSPHAILFSSHLFSPRLALFPRSRCAHHFSRRLLVSCSPEHFPLARLLLLAAYIRCCSHVSSLRSFARVCSRLSLALAFALTSLASPRSPLLRSCLCSPRVSPSGSSLLVPRLSSLPCSTSLFNRSEKTEVIGPETTHGGAHTNMRGLNNKAWVS